jgi:hypothetical protein
MQTDKQIYARVFVMEVPKNRPTGQAVHKHLKMLFLYVCFFLSKHHPNTHTQTYSLNLIKTALKKIERGRTGRAGNVPDMTQRGGGSVRLDSLCELLIIMNPI